MAIEHPKRDSAGRCDEQDVQQAAERGAESYGGDPDTEPSVSEEEIERGSKQDQAEG